MNSAGSKSEHENAIINISGMSCNHCARRVEDSLNKLPGVVEAKVSFNEQKAIIKYSADKVSLEKLKGNIKNTGYEVVD